MTANFCDDEGNLTAKENSATRYEYDCDWRNRLVAARMLVNSGSGFEHQWEVDYAYDAFNQLVRRTDDSPADSKGNPDDAVYVYEGGQMVLALERWTFITQRFVWGPQTDQLLATEYPSGFYGNGFVYWPLADMQGTIHDTVRFHCAENPWLSVAAYRY